MQIQKIVIAFLKLCTDVMFLIPLFPGLGVATWKQQSMSVVRDLHELQLRCKLLLECKAMSSSSVSNRNKLTYVDWGNIMYGFNEKLYTGNIILLAASAVTRAARVCYLPKPVRHLCALEGHCHLRSWLANPAPLPLSFAPPKMENSLVPESHVQSVKDTDSVPRCGDL